MGIVPFSIPVSQSPWTSIRVSQTKYKVSTFSLFLGKSILEKICFEHFQKVKLSTLHRSDWEFSGQNKTEFEVCLSFCYSFSNEWPIPTEYHFGKVDLSIPFTNSPSNYFQKSKKKQHKFMLKSQRIEES